MSVTSPQTSLSVDVMLVDSEETTARLAPMLRTSYRVVVLSNVATARAVLGRGRVDVIVTDLALPDGTGSQLCREAKALPIPPAVLVTTEQVHHVPDALEARCDGVLLKPFDPNLLVARLARLIRGRAIGARSNNGTNRFWGDTACPYCNARGVTSFEFASHRRSWYACGRCKKVWLAKRQE